MKAYFSLTRIVFILVTVLAFISQAIQHAHAAVQPSLVAQLEDYARVQKTVVIFSGDFSLVTLPNAGNFTTASNELSNIQQGAQWFHKGNIDFLPRLGEEICDTYEQQSYDALYVLMQFAKTLNAEQIATMKQKGGALSLKQLSPDQKRQITSMIKKYKSDLMFGNESLGDMVSSQAEENDFKFFLSFHLLASFFSPQFTEGTSGGTFTELPDRWRKREPIVPAPASMEESIKNLSSTSYSSEVGAQVGNLSFPSIDPPKSLEMGQISSFQNHKILVKSLKQWINDVSRVTGISLAVDSQIAERPVAIIASPTDKEKAEDLLSSIAFAADSGAHWRRIGNLHFLSLTSKIERCRQKLVVPFQHLNDSVADYVFDRFAPEVKQLQLPKTLFFSPRKKLVDWPVEVRKFVKQLAANMPENTDKKVLLDSAFDKEVQVEFTVIPVLSILYKEQESPYGLQPPVVIESLIITNPLVLK